MQNTPGTSFIPKKTIQKLGSPIKRKRFYVVSFVVTILFFVSLILSVGAFLYKNFSESQLTEQREALEAEREKYNQSDIEGVRELESRINIVESLFDRHVAVTKIFEEIESITTEKIQYNSFEYLRRASGGITLILDGVSEEFNSVILQKQSLEDSDVLFGGIVSGVKYSASGDDQEKNETTEVEEPITFTITMDIPLSAVAYRKLNENSIFSPETSSTSPSNISNISDASSTIDAVNGESSYSDEGKVKDGSDELSGESVNTDNNESTI